MKRFTRWLFENWQPIFFSVISISLLLFVSAYHLDSITHNNLSAVEVNSVESASAGMKIVNNPLFLPYKIGIYAVLNFGGGSVYLLRAVSALFGVILVLLFYAIARAWFSPRIAWMTTIMLATSSLFLNYSRLAVPDILLPLGLLGLIALGWWVNKSEKAGTFLLIGGAVMAAALYTPGLVWFLLLVVVVQRKHLRTTFKRLPIVSILGFILIGLILIAPLIRSFVLSPVLIKDWLALPASVDLQSLLKQFIYVPASLIVRSLSDPVFNLGHLPYLDIFTICIAILGTYAYMVRFSLIRTRALVGALIISWLLIAFNSTVSVVILLPIIYLTVAGGIMFMLQQWYSVFPKNPIARGIGVGLMLAVISISLFYNINRYFVAWPNSPIPRISFQQTLPPNLVQ